MKYFILSFGYALGAAVVLTGWWHGSGGLFAVGGASTWLAVGRLTGLLGFYHLLWQFLLIGRLPLFDRLVGFDRLARWHHWNAAAALLFIIIHPICITIAYGSFSAIPWWHQFGNFITGDDLLAAFFGLVVLVLVAVSSWLARLLIRSYERWYLVHLAAYAGALLAFGHQLEFGGDFSQLWFAVWWQAMTGAAVALFVGYRFVLPLAYYWRHRFVVKEVLAEAPAVVSIIITGRFLKQFSFQAGQFGIFRFFGPGVWKEAHPFSFSRVAGTDTLRITAKGLGDFTSQVSRSITPGMPVLIDGPHGGFTLPRKVRRVLLIGGGIGITPIRALAEAAVNKQLDTVVVYSTRQDSERIFKSEFSALAEGGSLVMISHTSSVAGHLTTQQLRQYVPDIGEREIFICGPQEMNHSLTRQLIAAGIPRRRIHWERFSFRSMRSEIVSTPVGEITL